MKIKLKKMRNLYYVEIEESRPTLQHKKGYVDPSVSACTRGVSPSHYIVASNNSKEIREVLEKELTKGYPNQELISFNLKFKTRKIGLTNKKKGVMFSWIC